MLLMSPSLTWQKIFNCSVVLLDSFESEGLHYSFSSAVSFTEVTCITYLPLRRLALPRKEPFLK